MPPSTNHLFAGNGRRRYKTKEYAAWIDEAGWLLNQQRITPIKGKVRLLIEVAEPKTNRALDCSNRIKLVEDFLVSRGITGDDRNCQKATAEKNREVSDQCCRVTIQPLE